MKPFLVLLACGLVSILLFPQEWRLALLVGWSSAFSAEILLAKRRMMVLGKSVRNHQFLSVLVFGFLGRLSLLFVGAILGAKTGWYPEGVFMAASLAAIFVGEAISLPQLAKATRRSRPPATEARETTPPS